MAIVNSVFVGRAQKSAGNGTFRTVRGRTIVSQKVSKRGAVVGSLSQNQFALAVISRFASIHAADIDVSFDRTTYGSSRNAFFKLNYAPMKEAVKLLWTNSLKTGAAKLPTDAEIEEAIATYAQEHPNTIYRIKKAGEAVVYLSGAWEDSSNPIVWGNVLLNGTAVKNGDSMPQLKDEDRITLEYSGSLSAAPNITFKVQNDNKNATTPTNFGSNELAAPDLDDSGELTYWVTGSLVGKYLRAIMVGSKTLVSFNGEGGEIFT